MTRPVRLGARVRAGTLLLAAVAVGCASGPSAPLSVSEGPASGYAVVGPLLTAWAEAVNADDVGDALALYDPAARVYLTHTAQYPELAQALEEWFGEVESILIGPADFGASNQLAYGTVRVLVVPADGGPRRRGVMTVVASSTTGTWRIRGQYLAIR